MSVRTRARERVKERQACVRRNYERKQTRDATRKRQSYERLLQSRKWSGFVVLAWSTEELLQVKKVSFGLGLIKKLLVPYLVRWRAERQRKSIQREQETRNAIPKPCCEYFKKFPLFSSLPSAHLTRMIDELHCVTLPSNHLVIPFNTSSNGFYVIHEGRVDSLLLRCDAETVVLTEGDIFGETQQLVGGKHFITCITRGECILWWLPSNSYKAILSTVPKDIYAKMLIIALEQQANAKTGIESLTSKDLQTATPDIFSEVPDEVLCELITLARPASVAPGTVINEKGTAVKKLVVLTKGVIEVSDVLEGFTSAQQRAKPLFLLGIEMFTPCRQYIRTYTAAVGCTMWSIAYGDVIDLLMRPSPQGGPEVFMGVQERATAVLHKLLASVPSGISVNCPVLGAMFAKVSAALKHSVHILPVSHVVLKSGALCNSFTLVLSGVLTSFDVNNKPCATFTQHDMVDSMLALLHLPSNLNVLVMSRFAIVAIFPISALKERSQLSNMAFNAALKQYETLHGSAAATEVLQRFKRKQVQSLAKLPSFRKVNNSFRPPRKLKEMVKSRVTREQTQKSGGTDNSASILSKDLALVRVMLGTEGKKAVRYVHTLEPEKPYFTPPVKSVAERTPSTQISLADEVLPPPVGSLVGHALQQMLGEGAVSFDDDELPSLMPHPPPLEQQPMLETRTPVETEQHLPMLSAVMERQELEYSLKSRAPPPVRLKKPPRRARPNPNGKLWDLMTCSQEDDERPPSSTLSILEQTPVPPVSADCFTPDNDPLTGPTTVVPPHLHKRKYHSDILGLYRKGYPWVS